MKWFTNRLVWALLLSLAATTLVQGVEDIVGTARTVMEKSRKAVVTIKVVLKIKQSFGGQTREQDQKVEVSGTVMDPSGMTVAAASSIDPTAQLKASGMPIECEVKETIILQDDGTEVEADVVLKDTDLDLAFLRPREAKGPFDAVSLKPRATPLQALDPIFVVNRLGKLGNRTPALSLGIVRALVKGPRPFYVCDNDVSGSAGCVAYAADGEPVGLFVTKLSQEPGAGRGRDAAIAILRPVADVLEIAEQAKQAKVPEKKAEGAKKEEKKEEEKKEAK